MCTVRAAMSHDHGHDEEDDLDESDEEHIEVDHAAISEALHHAVERGEKVQIERAGLENEFWNGFPLVVNDDFVLMRTLHDFALDGFAVLRVRDITSVRSSETERFFERVLRSEGMLDKLSAPRPVLLRSWRSVLESVRAHYRFAILECEREGDFTLGEIVSVDDEAVSLHYIQVNGTRESSLTRVALDDLTLLRFDEQYVNLFGKYSVCEDKH